MANKPFRSVNDQISILRSRGITIDDEVYASNFLINRNYYSMINDYGRFFTVTSDVYISGTTLKDINSVYLFDKAIKTILYTHSLEFEKYLKSTLAYYFCLQHPNSYDYLNINCYKHKSNKERLNAIDIISRIAKVIDDYSKKHNTNGIRHYSRVHTNIPLWVVIQFMYLGDVIKLYRCCEDSVQTDVAKMFSSFLISNTSMPNQILGTRELLTIMQNVRDFRNCVAHDNRILNMKASIKTKQRHDSMFKAMIPDSLKKKDILKVTTSDVQSSINAYCLNHTQAQMNHAMCIWRQIYKAALTAEIPVIDRSQMVIVPKSKIVRKKKDNSITYEQFVLFADELLKYNCTNETGRHRSAAIWYACQIMLYTGLRPQEVYALSKSDIDLESMQISINKSVGSTSTSERQIVPVKTIYSDAIIPISTQLKPILEQMIAWSKNDELLLADIDGKPFDIDLVCTLIVNVSRKCKSKYGFTFNQYKLRHLFSKDLFEANVNPKVIQALMRHANENMSLYYAYTTDEDKAKAIENRKL